MILLCSFVHRGQVWLTMPDYMSEITTLVQTGRQRHGRYLLAGGKMLLCALGSLILSVMTGFLAAQVAASPSPCGWAGDLPAGGEFSMERSKPLFHRQPHHPSTNDVTQIQFLIAMGLQNSSFSRPPSWQCGPFANPIQELAVDRRHLAAVAFMLVLIVIAVTCHAPVQTGFRLTDNLGTVTRENLTGLR